MMQLHLDSKVVLDKQKKALHNSCLLQTTWLGCADACKLMFTIQGAGAQHPQNLS